MSKKKEPEERVKFSGCRYAPCMPWSLWGRIGLFRFCDRSWGSAPPHLWISGDKFRSHCSRDTEYPRGCAGDRYVCPIRRRRRLGSSGYWAWRTGWNGSILWWVVASFSPPGYIELNYNTVIFEFVNHKKTAVFRRCLVRWIVLLTALFPKFFELRADSEQVFQGAGSQYLPLFEHDDSVEQRQEV